jgi:TetR/AcrR family transcriptional repressor of nem operon
VNPHRTIHLDNFLFYDNVPTARYKRGKKMDSSTKGEKTKARVLETATRLINEKGFCNTSINDVIEATGVKKGNLYFHFASKEELSLAILKEASKQFAAFLCERLQGERPLDRLANLLDAVLEKQSSMRYVGG